MPRGGAETHGHETDLQTIQVSHRSFGFRAVHNFTAAILFR